MNLHISIIILSLIHFTWISDMSCKSPFRDTRVYLVCDQSAGDGVVTSEGDLPTKRTYVIHYIIYCRIQ